ncbi:MAG TPA: urease accessory protein UreE [Vicinamibacterales bacterium]|nr:urease accessory protein UreE [Vicinamibacterales bacterium]
MNDVCREDALPERARPYAADTITLGWEDRLKARARRRSDGGAEFATTLERGVVLSGGDVFVIDELALSVAVVERPEPVFVVRPKNAAEAALFGYQIGNSHQPLMITGDAIVCADLPGMEQILEQYGIPFERTSRPFTPVSGAADHSHHQA